MMVFHAMGSWEASWVSFLSGSDRRTVVRQGLGRPEGSHCEANPEAASGGPGTKDTILG